MKRIATIVALICAVTFQVNAQNTESEILNFDPLLQWGCSIAGGKTEALYNTDEDGYCQAIYRPVGK